MGDVAGGGAREGLKKVLRRMGDVAGGGGGARLLGKDSKRNYEEWVTWLEVVLGKDSKRNCEEWVTWLEVVPGRGHHFIYIYTYDRITKSTSGFIKCFTPEILFSCFSFFLSRSTHTITMHNKAYTILITLELGSIGIKYQVSNTNPFQQSTPTLFLFLTAIFCHAVASMADMSLPTTIIIFHLSGVLGCETLLWILLPEFWKWLIINLFLLVVTSFCFFNFMDNISKLFRGTPSKAVHAPNLEPAQEADNA